MRKGSSQKRDKSVATRQEESVKKHIERQGQSQGQSQGQMDQRAGSRAAGSYNIRAAQATDCRGGEGQGWPYGVQSPTNSTQQALNPSYGSSGSNPSGYQHGPGHHQHHRPLPPINPSHRGYQTEYGQQFSLRQNVGMAGGSQPYNSPQPNYPPGEWQTRGITPDQEYTYKTDIPGVHNPSGGQQEGGWSRDPGMIDEKPKGPDGKDTFLLHEDTYKELVKTGFEDRNYRGTRDEPMEVEDTEQNMGQDRRRLTRHLSKQEEREQRRRHGSEGREETSTGGFGMGYPDDTGMEHRDRNRAGDQRQNGRGRDFRREEEEQEDYDNLPGVDDEYSRRNKKPSNSKMEDHRVSMERSLSTSGRNTSTSGVDDFPDADSAMEFYESRDKLEFIEKNCTKESGPNPKIFLAKLKLTYRDKRNRISKVEFGKKSKKQIKEKVIMLVGGTGSGKSTMINAIFNYMNGIQWNDDYRLKLIAEPKGNPVSQAESQTHKITAYTIHHQPWFTVPYTLTIVDTPGFGDTGGIKRDQEIMEQIGNFFATQGDKGIDHLHAVGFVVQSALPRLTKIQRYVFDSILSIFGKDVAQNIFMLLTFADGQKPQVLAGLKEAKMTYQNFYKFNNSALYVGSDKGRKMARNESDDESNSDSSSSDDDDGTSFDQMFWKMGAGNFNKFMTDLETVEPQSLALTAEVLKERNVLEMTTNSIQENIKLGLKKLEQLKIEKDLLKRHETDIKKNKNFEFEVPEPQRWKVKLQKGRKALNCSRCHYSCDPFCNHYYIRTCYAINYMGYCYNCPGKCNSSYHEFKPFKYEIRTVMVKKTSDDIKRRYEEAAGRKLTTEQLISKCSEEFDEVQEATMQLTEKARKCLARLDEIALKPNPLSTTDYIDLMIQEEEFMKEPGWKETVKQLKEVKKRASSFQQLSVGNYDPFGTSKGKAKPKSKNPEPEKHDAVVAKMYQQVEEFEEDQKPCKDK